MHINNLRVNGIDRPLGIDEQRPRLSWQMIQIDRSKTLSHYQVWVAKTEEDLARQRTIWDSGKQIGMALHMEYAGSELEKNSTYCWKVGIWDEEGRYAESEAARWETGLFAEDWTAEWIWSSDEVMQNDFAYLRKEFEITKRVDKAKLYVSAHHYYKAFVNAEQVGGYVSPAPTNPTKRKYYLAYDVTKSLHVGRNVVASIAHYLGGDGQNYVNGQPGFRLQLHVTYEDGTEEVMITDPTWQVLREIPHRRGTVYQQDRKISAIEDYDARKDHEAWMNPNFPEHYCQQAVQAAIKKDDYPMQWQQIPEGRVDEEISPVKLPLDIEEEQHVQVFDTGKIVSGWPQIRLKGIEGCTIRMRYSEDLDDHGRVKHNVANEKAEYYYDQYTMRGKDWETWSPDFSYKAFRYVEITGYPHDVVPGENLVICSVHTGMDKIGDFHCSDPFLNDMYAASMQTQKNNVLGQPVDCPHREQAQYLTDTDIQAEAMLYNFDAIQVLEKTLSDFSDGQWENGLFPFVFPTNTNNPRFNIHIPEWDLHYCTLMWKVYEMSNDQRVLARSYETMTKMIRHYMHSADPVTGLIPRKEDSWHISDWPYPTVDHSGTFYTVQQIKAWQGLQIAAKTANILGFPQDEGQFNEWAERLHDNIVKHLYDSERKRFYDNDQKTAMHQGVGALALYAGIDVGEDRKEAIDIVAQQQWEAKTVLSLPLFRLLFENGYEDKAYQLMKQKEYPGWGHMIAQGSKTMWEGWDDIESHSHAWNGYPARFMQEYIAGIRPADITKGQVQIAPYMPDDLTFAKVKVPTSYGKVYAAWKREDSKKIYLELKIPGALTAKVQVALPSDNELITIEEKDQLLWNKGERIVGQLAGVEDLQVKDRLVTLELLPGTYHITFNME